MAAFYLSLQDSLAVEDGKMQLVVVRSNKRSNYSLPCHCFSFAVMSRAAWLPHIIYSLAITSISLHFLNAKKAAEESRRHYTAQISILETIHARLIAGEDVPDALWKLARANTDGELANATRWTQSSADEVGWRDMILGRRRLAGEMARSDELDQRDLDRSMLLFWVYSISADESIVQEAFKKEM